MLLLFVSSCAFLVVALIVVASTCNTGLALDSDDSDVVDVDDFVAAGDCPWFVVVAFVMMMVVWVHPYSMAPY